MGIKKYIPGLRPKASTSNLVVPIINNGSYPSGYGGYNTSPLPQPTNNNIYSIPNNNIYSIPEFGSAAAPQQPRTVAIPSFEASRSVSSGSSTSTTNTNFSSPSTSIRTFSGAKPTLSEPRRPEPQVTANDVRRCTKLLRQMFELHLELWTLTYTHGTDQYRRQEKRLQVDAILADIHHMVGTWHHMPPSTWTEEEYEEIKWIAQTLADLPPPR